MTEKNKETNRKGVTPEALIESKEELDKRMNRYAYFIIAIILLTIGISAGYLIWNSINSHFFYSGMEFNRIVKNNENVYSTSFTTKSKINGTFYIDNRTFYLRNNPKYLRLDQQIEGKVPVITNKEVYVSIDEPLPNCEDRVRSLFDLSASLVNYGLSVRGAVTNQTKSQQNYTEITCANSTLNTIIIITFGNYTGYSEIKANCYEISFDECSTLNKATEGFTLKLLERAADTLGLNRK